MRGIVPGAAAVIASAAVANAQIVNFIFPIDTIQEVPAPTIPPGGPVPSGTGDVSFNTMTNELDWTISYQDLTGSIVAPGAHFHGPAGPGMTAGVQVFLSDGNPPEPASGTLTGSATLTSQQASDLLAGLWYVNIHTQMNQPGEIRGQVVPEPATLGALVLGGLALLRRRS